MVRVLVVDDEPLMLRNVRRMVEQAHKSFKVVGEAYDGEEALKKIEELSPDVVITDIKMPVMDGLELINEIKTRKINVFTVLLSGYRDFEYARKAVTLDAIEYLLKPLSIDVLKELFDNILLNFDKKVMGIQTEVLTKIIKGNVRIESKELSLFNFAYYTHLLICAGSYYLFATHALIPSKTFWLRNPFKDLVEKHLKNIDKYWIIDGEHENERLIVIAWNDSFMDITNECANLHNELADKQMPITTITGSVSQDLDAWIL
jgi:two-component system, response regulator YesN